MAQQAVDVAGLPKRQPGVGRRPGHLGRHLEGAGPVQGRVERQHEVAEELPQRSSFLRVEPLAVPIEGADGGQGSRSPRAFPPGRGVGGKPAAREGREQRDLIGERVAREARQGGLSRAGARRAQIGPAITCTATPWRSRPPRSRIPGPPPHAAARRGRRATDWPTPILRREPDRASRPPPPPGFHEEPTSLDEGSAGGRGRLRRPRREFQVPRGAPLRSREGQEPFERAALSLGQGEVDPHPRDLERQDHLPPWSRSAARGAGLEPRDGGLDPRPPARQRTKEDARARDRRIERGAGVASRHHLRVGKLDDPVQDRPRLPREPNHHHVPHLELAGGREQHKVSFVQGGALCSPPGPAARTAPSRGRPGPWREGTRAVEGGPALQRETGRAAEGTRRPHAGGPRGR